jgi:hypothetical protein
MKKLFVLGLSILFVFSIINCVSMPDVIRSSEIMPSSQGYHEPAETIFPITIEQFQDTRPDKRAVGYQSMALGGSNSVIVDRDISSILETIVTRELGFKGLKSGNSIFIFKGSVQRMARGNMPGAKAGYSVLGELAVELTIFNTRKNASVWSKTFAGKGSGDDYKTVLAQALKEFTDDIRKDDSILKVKDIYITALAEQPAEAGIASTRKIRTKKKSGASAKPDVDGTSSTDQMPAIIVRSDVDKLPAIKVKHNKNAYAIVIGIENYRQKLPKADFAVSDAKLVSDYLTKVMGYPEENVVLLTNDKALQSDMTKYFEKWLHNNVEKNSTVFIYYSGHGAPDHKTGGAYLVPYDGDPSFIAETGYSLKRMYDALGKLQAKEIIVALDSCFSGAGGRSVIAKGARPLVMNLQSNMALSSNMTVLSASSGEQISSTYDEKGHGLFTYFLLKGIKNEDVLRQDGSIKMDDLFGYLKPQVERIARKQYNNEQTPQLIGAKKN